MLRPPAVVGSLFALIALGGGLLAARCSSLALGVRVSPALNL
jgi:hypothetical protein